MNHVTDTKNAQHRPNRQKTHLKHVEGSTYVDYWKVPSWTKRNLHPSSCQEEDEDEICHEASGRMTRVQH